MTGSEKKKLFTVEEANQMLPLVRAIVQDIVDLYAEVHDRRERLAKIRQLPSFSTRDEDNVYSEELQQVEKEIDQDTRRLQEFVDELQELGVELKDPLKGLVDFPTEIDGRQAYLCWMLGENELGYWHELDAGFQGRQSLMENTLSGDQPTDEDRQN